MRAEDEVAAVAEGFGVIGWMIIKRDSLLLEFFPHPELDPAASWFSCCLRLDDLDDFYSVRLAAGIPEANKGTPVFISRS